MWLLNIDFVLRLTRKKIGILNYQTRRKERNEETWINSIRHLQRRNKDRQSEVSRHKTRRLESGRRQRRWTTKLAVRDRKPQADMVDPRQGVFVRKPAHTEEIDSNRWSEMD